MPLLLNRQHPSELEAKATRIANQLDPSKTTCVHLCDLLVKYQDDLKDDNVTQVTRFFSDVECLEAYAWRKGQKDWEPENGKGEGDRFMDYWKQNFPTDEIPSLWLAVGQIWAFEQQALDNEDPTRSPAIFYAYKCANDFYTCQRNAGVDITD